MRHFTRGVVSSSRALISGPLSTFCLKVEPYLAKGGICVMPSWWSVPQLPWRRPSPPLKRSRRPFLWRECRHRCVRAGGVDRRRHWQRHPLRVADRGRTGHPLIDQAAFIGCSGVDPARAWLAHEGLFGEYVMKPSPRAFADWPADNPGVCPNGNPNEREEPAPRRRIVADCIFNGGGCLMAGRFRLSHQRIAMIGMFSAKTAGVYRIRCWAIPMARPCKWIY